MESDDLNFEPENKFDPVPVQPEIKRSFEGTDNRYCRGESTAPRCINSQPRRTIAEEDFPEENFGIPTNPPPPTTPTQNAFQRENHIPPAPMYNNYGNYPQPIQAQPVPVTKRKASLGLIIFMVIMCGVMVGTVIGFAVFLGSKNNTVKNNPFEELFPEESSITEQFKDAETYNDYYEKILEENEKNKAPKKKAELITNKKWKGLKLNKPKSTKKTEPSAQYAYQTVSPATVAVLSYTDKIKKDSEPEGQGTGMIITSDGYIVTNSHVIGDSKTAYHYQIMDNEGKKYTPKVIGYDTRTDIAVLKIDVKNMPCVEFGMSNDLRIGDDIIAVGNPGGIEFQNSLTKGIVSAKGRSLSSSTVPYIQTDAAINPGNSGGPLCNLYGQVVGINTAKISSSLYEGMGFAIPSETVKDIVDDIITQGYVSNRVRIGITGLALNSAVCEYYSVPQGIMITQIDKDGSLYGSEVECRDIITELDGESVTSFKDIYSILEKHIAGDKVKLVYCHFTDKDGKKHKEMTTKITLAADNGETQN